MDRVAMLAKSTARPPAPAAAGSVPRSFLAIVTLGQLVTGTSAAFVRDRRSEHPLLSLAATQAIARIEPAEGDRDGRVAGGRTRRLAGGEGRDILGSSAGSDIRATCAACCKPPTAPAEADTFPRSVIIQRTADRAPVDYASLTPMQVIAPCLQVIASSRPSGSSTRVPVPDASALARARYRASCVGKMGRWTDQVSWRLC